MTNGEKYKTAQERASVFNKYCSRHMLCEDCELFEIHRNIISGRPICAYTWLDLEADDEKPFPCIWCKHETYVCVGQNYGQVRCRNCMAEGPATDSKEHAITNYNRVAKRCMEMKE